MDAWPTWRSPTPKAVRSGTFRRPAQFLLPGWWPKFALLFEVVSLLQLPLSGVAAEKGAAVLMNPVAEVLTSHANHASLPAL